MTQPTATPTSDATSDDPGHAADRADLAQDPVGSDGPAPSPSHRRALAITVALVALWAGITVFARPLAPMIGTVAGWVEVGLGLDVAIGEDEE